MGPIAAAVNITGITQAYNGQVTATNHGLAAGDIVFLSGIGGMTQLNNLSTYVNTVIDANNFTISTNTTNYTAYTSGGTVQKVEQFTDDQNGNLASNLGGTGTVNYVTGAVTTLLWKAGRVARGP